MTIELTARAAAHAFATYLEGCGCTVELVGERLLEVSLPERSQSPREAAIELEAYPAGLACVASERCMAC